MYLCYKNYNYHYFISFTWKREHVEWRLVVVVVMVLVLVGWGGRGCHRLPIQGVCQSLQCGQDDLGPGLGSETVSLIHELLV